MYGKMQESGLTEIFPSMCISAIWDQHSELSHPEPPRGALLVRVRQLQCEDLMTVTSCVYWQGRTSQVAQWKITLLPLQEMQETWVWSLGWEDPLEEEMATHSRILAWKVLWTEEPGRLQSMGFQRLGHDWAHTTTQTRQETVFH